MADMDQPDRIHLRDHVVSAEIGAFQSERGRDQRLRFDVAVDLASPVSGAEDQVDRILSYDLLVQAIDTALCDQRYNLVETLAERIAAAILVHPQAARVRVTVEKLDRGPGALGITISRDAGRVAVAERVMPVRLLIWRRPAALPECALLILPDELAEGCDRLARIPQAGRADSLNLAVATGVMLFEARRHLLSFAETGA